MNACIPYVVKLKCEKIKEPRKGEILPGLFQCMEVNAMPRKPKHPCHHPGCPELTENRYCEKHTKLHNALYEKYDRDPAVRRRYGRAWKRIRDSYVKTHPFCEECYRRGILVPVEEVHHKLPLAEGGTHARDNLISLCRSCHARIHAERGDRWHNKQKASTDEKASKEEEMQLY